MCNFGRGHHEKHFCVIFFLFEPVVQEKMQFQNISYLELEAPMIGRGEPFVKFGRGHPEVHFCESILNLNQWFRR